MSPKNKTAGLQPAAQVGKLSQKLIHSNYIIPFQGALVFARISPAQTQRSLRC